MRFRTSLYRFNNLRSKRETERINSKDGSAENYRFWIYPNYRVSLASVSAVLPPTMGSLMAVFVANPGKWMTANELFEAMHFGIERRKPNSPSYIAVQIYHLRRNLRQHGISAGIESERGKRNYRFVGFSACEPVDQKEFNKAPKPPNVKPSKVELSSRETSQYEDYRMWIWPEYRVEIPGASVVLDSDKGESAQGAILAMLVANRDKRLEIEDLFNAMHAYTDDGKPNVYGGDGLPEINVATVQLHYLRKKLQSNGIDADITSMRGRGNKGYIFRGFRRCKPQPWEKPGQRTSMRLDKSDKHREKSPAGWGNAYS